MLSAELTQCDQNRFAPACPVTGPLCIRPGTTLTPRTERKDRTMTGRTTADQRRQFLREAPSSSESVEVGRIALVINTKNEEEKLAGALESCPGVDDIV